LPAWCRLSEHSNAVCRSSGVWLLFGLNGYLRPKKSFLKHKLPLSCPNPATLQLSLMQEKKIGKMQGITNRSLGLLPYAWYYTKGLKF